MDDYDWDDPETPGLTVCRPVPDSMMSDEDRQFIEEETRRQLAEYGYAG